MTLKEFLELLAFKEDDKYYFYNQEKDFNNKSLYDKYSGFYRTFRFNDIPNEYLDRKVRKFCINDYDEVILLIDKE